MSIRDERSESEQKQLERLREWLHEAPPRRRLEGGGVYLFATAVISALGLSMLVWLTLGPLPSPDPPAATRLRSEVPAPAATVTIREDESGSASQATPPPARDRRSVLRSATPRRPASPAGSPGGVEPSPSAGIAAAPPSPALTTAVVPSPAPPMTVRLRPTGVGAIKGVVELLPEVRLARAVATWIRSQPPAEPLRPEPRHAEIQTE